MSKLWLPFAIYREMEMLANESFPYETGGMWMGYLADNGEVVVQKLIGPGSAAKHGPYHFEPDSIYQQTHLEQYFLQSGGRTTYLGDWHTHPLRTTNLSSTDKPTLANLAATPSSQIAHPVMAVLAGAQENWELGAVQFLGMHRRWLIRHYSLLPLKINLI